MDENHDVQVGYVEEVKPEVHLARKTIGCVSFNLNYHYIHETKSMSWYNSVKISRKRNIQSPCQATLNSQSVYKKKKRMLSNYFLIIYRNEHDLNGLMVYHHFSKHDIGCLTWIDYLHVCKRFFFIQFVNQFLIFLDMFFSSFHLNYCSRYGIGFLQEVLSLFAFLHPLFYSIQFTDWFFI